jgi:hypothetical protein
MKSIPIKLVSSSLQAHSDMKGNVKAGTMLALAGLLNKTPLMNRTQQEEYTSASKGPAGAAPLPLTANIVMGLQQLSKKLGLQKSEGDHAQSGPMQNNASSNERMMAPAPHPHQPSQHYAPQQPMPEPKARVPPPETVASFQPPLHRNPVKPLHQLEAILVQNEKPRPKPVSTRVELSNSPLCRHQKGEPSSALAYEQVKYFIESFPARKKKRPGMIAELGVSPLTKRGRPEFEALISKGVDTPLSKPQKKIHLSDSPLFEHCKSAVWDFPHPVRSAPAEDKSEDNRLKASNGRQNHSDSKRKENINPTPDTFARGGVPNTINTVQFRIPTKSQQTVRMSQTERRPFVPVTNYSGGGGGGHIDSSRGYDAFPY